LLAVRLEGANHRWLASAAKPPAIVPFSRLIDVNIETSVRLAPKSWISWLGAGLIAAPPVSMMVYAAGDAHKVSVVSFGLFGDQGVFRSEATGAAQVVATQCTR
jgi:hypothetical protein